MSRRDTKRTAKRSIQAQELALDIPPHNTIKKHKAKERQEARKEVEDFKKLKVEQIVLSNEDFDHLVEKINNPPEPSPALKAARKRFLELQNGESQKKKK